MFSPFTIVMYNKHNPQVLALPSKHVVHNGQMQVRILSWGPNFTHFPTFTQSEYNRHATNEVAKRK